MLELLSVEVTSLLLNEGCRELLRPEKVESRINELDDGSVPVLFFRKTNQWYCRIGDPPEAQNLKGIQPIINLYPQPM